MDEKEQINDLIQKIDEQILSLLESREELMKQAKKSNIKITNKKLDIMETLKSKELNNNVIEQLLKLLKES